MYDDNLEPRETECTHIPLTDPNNYGKFNGCKCVVPVHGATRVSIFEEGYCAGCESKNDWYNKDNRTCHASCPVGYVEGPGKGNTPVAMEPRLDCMKVDDVEVGTLPTVD